MFFHLQTFGCKSNQYESQAIRERLLRAGWVEVGEPAQADVYIINTCGVTSRAVASCRNALRKAARSNPGLRLAVTGCGVDLGEEWPKELGSPLLIPNAAKADIAALLSGETPPLPVDNFALSVSAFHGHTRAFLKIQDGCNNFCTYCAVPHARGAPRSRTPEDVLAEAAELVAHGHGEVVLTGINIGAYRHGDVSFSGIVSRLAETPGLARLRLGSVEPPYVTPDLVAAMRHPKVCAHLHLPLQSGDDGVLATMGRKYTTADFLRTVEMLHSDLNRPAITTDVIVGFPGEDEAAFANTMATCRAAGFSRLHVFLFSPRLGTPAAAMQRRVTDREVEGRKSRLIASGNEAAKNFAKSCVGLRERVIIESNEGFSDRYVRVRVAGLKGSCLEVRITGMDGDILTAAVCP